MEKIIQNRDTSADSPDSICPVKGSIHYLQKGSNKKSMSKESFDMKDLEKVPRTVGLLTEDLKNSVPVLERYGINRSDIARFGLRRLNERLMEIIPKDLIAKEYPWDIEECSIRYSKFEAEVAESLEKVFVCKFSDLGRCGYHVGVAILTSMMNEEEKNEEEFTGDKSKPDSLSSDPRQ